VDYGDDRRAAMRVALVERFDAFWAGYLSCAPDSTSKALQIQQVRCDRRKCTHWCGGEDAAHIGPTFWIFLRNSDVPAPFVLAFCSWIKPVGCLHLPVKT
jgi:hypothetical protein